MKRLASIISTKDYFFFSPFPHTSDSLPKLQQCFGSALTSAAVSDCGETWDRDGGVGKGLKIWCRWWQDIFLPALRLLTPSLQHGALAALVSPAARLSCVFLPFPRTTWIPSEASGQGQHGHGHCPRSFSPAPGSFWGGRVRWRHLSSHAAFSALQLLVGIFPKRGEALGLFLVCFALIDVLSSTERKAEQQCRALPRPLRGSAGSVGMRSRQGQHP